MEAFLPSMPVIIEALPIIFSLIILEGLLSVDNALVLARWSSISRPSSRLSPSRLV